ncbi:MAG: hypothetical protein ACFFDN_52520 [Candidatus Hodarchaeota archaeon]
MIKSIYIMRENGELLYIKNFMKEKYDNNILIGFFTSVANFSREALGSIVKNLDLGENNKLILTPIPDEELLAAAIVSERDHIDLINKILMNIMQDFIDLFSPDYDPEKIYTEQMEEIIALNLRKRVVRAPALRIFFAWLCLLPLSGLLMLLSIYITTIFLPFFNLQEIYDPENLFTLFMPIIYLLSTFIIFFVFAPPNLVSGYLTVNRKAAYVNSIAYIILVILWFSLSIEPLYSYVIISNIPIVIIASIFFAYIGVRLSSKRNLVRK